MMMVEALTSAVSNTTTFRVQWDYMVPRGDIGVMWGGETRFRRSADEGGGLCLWPVVGEKETYH